MPITNSRMIQRETLMSLMDGLSGERVIYVCAPAGYGKTVAIRDWTLRSGWNNSFVSLDEFDNDPVHFCGRFCASLRSCQPDNFALEKIILHPAFDSAPEEFTLRALAAVSDGKRACLVIDDLHFIHNERTLRLLTALLKRLPESFQITLVSRTELPSCFSELWLKGRLAQITADDLRFTHGDIMRLYRERGYPITSEKANEILRLTDGWAIGIGVLMLSDGKPHGENLEYLDEFIRVSVWQQWDEAARDFMLKTSVVRELTPPLCTALTGVQDSGELLERLVRQNVFISRAERGIYRYHRLFYDFLCKMVQRLGPEFYSGALEKAGHWYLEQSDFYGAIDCFTRCENHEGIAKCFMVLSTAGGEYSLIENMIQVVNSSLIETIAQKYPYIYSALTWAAYNAGRADNMARYADQYYMRQGEIEASTSHLKLNIVLMRLVDFRCSLRELLNSIIEMSMGSDIQELSDMGLTLGIINQNMPLLHRGTRDFSECAMADVETSVAEMLVALGGIFGEEARLLAECLMAGLLYEQGCLEKAYTHAQAANAEIRENFSVEPKFCAMSVLSCVLDALDQSEQVEQIEQRISTMIERDGAYFLNYNFHAMKTRHKLGKGDIGAANRWIKEHGLLVDDGLDFYKSYGHITTCRAYIAKGDYDAAIVLLERIFTLAESYRRPLDVIEAKILLSIAYWKKKRGFQDRAIQDLEQAVVIAYQYGYIQLFVNDGAELAGMLQRLQKRVEQQGSERTVPVSFIKKIYLKAIEHQKDGLTSGQTVPMPQFTDKQKMVMRLQCEGKTYKEIAGAMGVKLPTLRSHIALIYKKLDVTCAEDAVMKIKSKGILIDE